MNRVVYKGNVILKIQDKFGNSHIINKHNDGLNGIGKFFADIMCDYTNVSYPEYIDIVDGANYSVLRLPSKITVRQYNETPSSTPEYIAHFETLISNKQVANPTASGDLKLVLLNSNFQQMCQLSLSDYSEVLSDYVSSTKALVVVWELKLESDNIAGDFTATPLIRKMFAKCLVGQNQSISPKYVQVRNTVHQNKLPTTIKIHSKTVQLDPADNFYYAHMEAVIGRYQLENSFAAPTEISITSTDEQYLGTVEQQNNILFQKWDVSEKNSSIAQIGDFNFSDNQSSYVIVWEVKLCNEIEGEVDNG